MKNLKRWMDEQGLDQVVVAPLIGCSQSTLSRVLNGQDASADFMRAAHRISEGAVSPNSFFPDLYPEALADSAN